MEKVFSRMGDGFPFEMTTVELMRDLEEGTADAADRGKIPPLSGDELDYLYELFRQPQHFVGVTRGKEVVLTYDALHVKLMRAAVPVDRIQTLQIYEKLLGADTIELGHVDYSFKPVKPITAMEQTVMEQALLVTHAPLFYGAMPNLGLYSRPDGPFANPSELLPQGKIREARESYEQCVEEAVKDIVYVGSALYESGADGINLDTTGAAGDADFLVGLRATEILKRKYPEICVEMGMAGEFVLGLHGSCTTMASVWPGCTRRIR